MTSRISQNVNCICTDLAASTSGAWRVMWLGISNAARYFSQQLLGFVTITRDSCWPCTSNKQVDLVHPRSGSLRAVPCSRRRVHGDNAPLTRELLRLGPSVALRGM